jgi:hypothetical protein
MFELKRRESRAGPQRGCNDRRIIAAVEHLVVAKPIVLPMNTQVRKRAVDQKARQLRRWRKRAVAKRKLGQPSCDQRVHKHSRQ